LTSALLPSAARAQTAPQPTTSSGTTVLTTTTEAFPYDEYPSPIGLTFPKRVLKTTTTSIGVRSRGLSARAGSWEHELQ
jgi:hypothetical protein